MSAADDADQVYEAIDEFAHELNRMGVCTSVLAAGIGRVWIDLIKATYPDLDERRTLAASIALNLGVGTN